MGDGGKDLTRPESTQRASEHRHGIQGPARVLEKDSVSWGWAMCRTALRIAPTCNPTSFSVRHSQLPTIGLHFGKSMLVFALSAVRLFLHTGMGSHFELYSHKPIIPGHNLRQAPVPSQAE